jgi:hypothetical protein
MDKKKKDKKKPKKKKHVPFQPMNERESDTFIMDTSAKGSRRFKDKKRDA